MCHPTVLLLAALFIATWWTQSDRYLNAGLMRPQSGVMVAPTALAQTQVQTQVQTQRQSAPTPVLLTSPISRTLF